MLCLLSFFVLHLATSAAITRSGEQRQQKMLLDRDEDFMQAASAKEVRRLLERKTNALDAVRTFGSGWPGCPMSPTVS